MEYAEKISRFANILKKSTRTFFITGAGISTESGIPDYRSPGSGVWEKVDPVKASSLSSLRKDPAEFYSINLERWIAYENCEPNIAHEVIANLEKLGYIMGTITQNIDSLHKKAGSERVWEVHGHLRTCRCMKCENRYDFFVLSDQVKNGNNPPLCSNCGGILRPDVVLFEDRLNEDFFKASQVLSGCQLLIVAGSSLTVYPVAGLPELSRSLVIINKTPTPWDDQAEIVINKASGQVFSDLMEELGESY
ncbi:MAG: NAD-dependent deacylase [Clostridiales bacterium]|nr:NAD-dependent deacylase [Clostridiales bacterium]MCF8022078.1 NAD-dependent deacylase [Clostridiales bacterium]